MNGWKVKCVNWGDLCGEENAAQESELPYELRSGRKIVEQREAGRWKS